jgi:hypothetical protein
MCKTSQYAISLFEISSLSTLLTKYLNLLADVLYSSKQSKMALEEIQDWIFYFVYEIDYGKEWTDETCSEADGTVIDISTSEKLYDYLTR